jgi:hypothetical protein
MLDTFFITKFACVSVYLIIEVQLICDNFATANAAYCFFFPDFKTFINPENIHLYHQKLLFFLKSRKTYIYIYLLQH